MKTYDAIKEEFKKYYGEKAKSLIKSPGRVNLIGEHTDYNEGFVLPMAIEKGVFLAFKPKKDGNIRLFSKNYGQEKSFNLKDIKKNPQGGWIEYAKGVASQYGECQAGFDGFVFSDIPKGAGLSSSAAFSMAICYALISSNNLKWDPVSAAKNAKAAENDFVGVACGIMDQMACALGQKGSAIRIDCKDESFKLAKLPSGCEVVILDSMTRRELLHSDYNKRQSECRSAAKALQVSSLRYIDHLEKSPRYEKLSPLEQKRARHVVSENSRVLRAQEAMRNNDPRALGRLMTESHMSLRYDFEVSTTSLDLLAGLSEEHPACYGARLTGAGFGGAVVALVMASHKEVFMRDVARSYQLVSGKECEVFSTKASEGALLAQLSQ